MARPMYPPRAEIQDSFITLSPAVGPRARMDRLFVMGRAPSAHPAKRVGRGWPQTVPFDGAGLQDRGAAAPHPVDVEAREPFRQHRPLEARAAPVRPAVGRY